MSPLLDLQRRYRELGRIRLGVKTDKGAPRRLNEFRLTSASDDLIERVADLYGGEIQEWKGAPTEGKQWEVFTGTDRLDVLIAPGEPISQNWELWTGGGCARRCDGLTMVDGGPCQCPADLEQRLEESKKGKACKPTSRLSVVLPRVPDVGVWRVESHGVNAAVELPGTVDLMRKALEAGIPIPGQLRIEQRTAKKNGQTHHFVVPVLELPTLTVEALMSGDVSNGALGAGAPRAITPPPPAAIEAPKPEPVQATVVEPAKRSAPRRSAAPKAAPPRQQPPLPGEDASTAPCPETSGGGDHDESRTEGDQPSQPDSHGDVASSQVDPPAAPAGDTPPANADDWDREALRNRIAALPDHLKDVLSKVWGDAGWGSIKEAAPDDRKLRQEHVDEVIAKVSLLERAAKTEWADRRKHANAAMNDVGIKKDPDRHAFVKEATDGDTESTGALTEEQLQQILDLVQTRKAEAHAPAPDQQPYAPGEEPF